MDDKSLDALFTGLTEVQSASLPKEPPSAPPQTVKDSKKAKEKSKKPSTTRTRQRQQEEVSHEERICTIVSSELYRKIRIIATREGLTIKNVIEAAFTKAVGSYERKHGPIKDDPKRDLKDLF